MFYGCRCAYPVESVHDEHRLFTFGSNICRQYLGRKTFTSFIDGCNLETVYESGLYFHGMSGGAYFDSVIKTTISNPGIYDVFLRFGSWFQRVVCSFPTQLDGIFLLTELNGEMADGQWLYNIV